MKLLFVTWDSDQTNYLESLFFPILQGLQEGHGFSCRVLQFSWASKGKVESLRQKAIEIGVDYTHFQVLRKPHPLLGTLWTLMKGSRYLKQYLQHSPPDLIMPRSTMPAVMVNRLYPWLRNQSIQVCFDADGLPLEERLDFTALKPSDFQYKLLKAQELILLKNADRILVRTQKAMEQHVNGIGEIHRGKFYKVTNGRPVLQFAHDENKRQFIRRGWGVQADACVFVYTGTLGPQYAWEEMWSIFEAFYRERPTSRFLILTAQEDFVKTHVPKGFEQVVIPLKVPFGQVPDYLSAADCAFCLRKPAPSMQGVSPIKLGEYLLMGLPTIVSKGIGDVEKELEGQPFVHFYDHLDPDRIGLVLDWVKRCPSLVPGDIREFALGRYSLEKSIQDYRQALVGEEVLGYC